MKRNHLYIGYSPWIDMEQLPNQLILKKWPIFYCQSVVLRTSKLSVLIGSTTSFDGKMSSKPNILDAIITSGLRMRIQKSFKWFDRVQITIMQHKIALEDIYNFDETDMQWA